MPLISGMPWLSIFSFFLTFLMSKASGKSTGAALLTGAAVGAATYVVADPANKDNLLGFGQPSAEALPTTAGEGDTQTTPGTKMVVGASSGLLDSAGNLVKAVAPYAVGAVAGASLANSPWLWLAIGIGAYAILN